MTSGGKRENSGRNKLPDHLRRVTKTFRLPQELLDRLPKKGQGRLVEAAIVRYLDEEEKNG